MTDLTKSLPPQSLATERALLSACININGATEAAIEAGATAELFHDSRHVVIFRALCEVHNNGANIEPLTLANKLKSLGDEEAAGGIEYYNGTLLDENPGTDAGISNYCKTLLELFHKRQIDNLISNLVDAKDYREKREILLEDVPYLLDRISTSSKVENPFKSLAEITATPAPTIEWAIDGIIPKNAITLLPAAGGSGKSFSALFMAQAVSEGLPFVGRGTIKLPTIIIDFEQSPDLQHWRAEHVGATSKNCFTWSAGTDTDATPWFLDSDNFSKYLTLPLFQEPAFIIIDSLRAGTPSSAENSNDEMGEVMNKKVRLLRNAGHTVLVIHHTTKADGIYRGAGVIKDAVDHVLELKLKGDTSTGTGSYRLKTGTKTRYGGNPVSYSINFLNGTINEVDGVQAEIEDRADEVDLMSDLIHEHIEMYEHPPNRNDLILAGSANLGWGKNKVVRVLNYGKGEAWLIDKGENNASLYKPI